MCKEETEAQTKTLAGTWSADISLVVRYSMNEIPPALVCLSVFVRRDDGGETETSREICVQQRKRYRDKIERPRQKRERKSKTELARVRNN